MIFQYNHQNGTLHLPIDGLAEPSPVALKVSLLAAACTSTCLFALMAPCDPSQVVHIGCLSAGDKKLESCLPCPQSV